MPRRGQFRRQFPAEADPQPPAAAGRIGERVVHATTSTNRRSTNRIRPTEFTCSTLAAELADEWVEYVAAAGLTAGTVASYQQAIATLCRFVDAQLGEQAAAASLGGNTPDLARLFAAWERTLPAGFATGSMRPAILSSAIRVLIRRRAEHPDRPVAARTAAFARAGRGVPKGEYTELDEFTRAEKKAMVRAAWKDVIALDKRLAAGWELAAAGQHPDTGSWLSIPDLLWGLANAAITPRDINDHLPGWEQWPPELVALVMRPDGTVPIRTFRTFVDRWLVAQLWPTTLDLHAFRVLLMDATGHPPEEVSTLTEDAVEFTPGGVRLTLVKKRAQRRYYRAFKNASLEVVDVTETKDFGDAPRREVSAILRRLMAVTERARQQAGNGKLFVRAAVLNDLTLTFTEWNPEAPTVRFSVWLDRHQITVAGSRDIKRLRKSAKVEKIVAARGHIHDAADDHHQETFRGHYAQGTTLRVVSAEVINAAQEHWFGRAVEPAAGPTVVTDQAAAASEASGLQMLGLSAQQADALIAGELDMGITHCKNPYASPFSPAGELCAVAPLRCLECRNAWVMPSQLPQLLLFSDHLERIRSRMTPARFTAVWGQSWVNLRAVLDDRSEAEIALARKHIADGDIALDLPLSAHVEFDT